MYRTGSGCTQDAGRVPQANTFCGRLIGTIRREAPAFPAAPVGAVISDSIGHRLPNGYRVAATAILGGLQP